MDAVKVDAELGPPVTPVVAPVVPEESELAIQNPVFPPLVAAKEIPTVYVVPAAGVVVLGVRVNVPATLPLPWQTVQSLALVGVACAACGLTVATKSATTAPVASTAIFGMFFLFRLTIRKGSSIGSGFGS